MNDQPKRRFWQLHLSTLVVLSFVAGGLMWLNRPYGWRFPGEPSPDTHIAQGWPWEFRFTDNMIYLKYATSENPYIGSYFNWDGFVWDCAVWLAILTAVAVVCERKAKP